jgi:2-oxoglutarate dehydrogenase E2 component (dihydrolipoamide succinyltransferase)
VPVAGVAATNGGGIRSAGTYTGHVTPVVARMITEHNLDLTQIAGTGRDGRVTKKDIENYLDTRQDTSAAPSAVPAWEQPVEGDLFKPTVEYGGETTPAPASTPTDTRLAERLHPPEPVPETAPGELVKLDNMRRAIADHMVRSKLQTSPHVTSVFEIDMTAVLAHREANKDAFARQGINLTLTAYFVAASVVALRENPYVNAQWTDDGIFLHRPAHVGLAVALDKGLIVPVIKNAQDYNLLGLSRAVNDLATRARDKQLKPDEVQGGTFTITNHGVSGSLVAMPIINQPQVAILGVGVMEKRVKVIDDAIAIRPMLYVSLTFDHRVIDGATGDSFLASLKHQMESWH